MKLLLLIPVCLVALSGFAGEDPRSALRTKVEKLSIEKVELQNVKLSEAIAVVRDLDLAKKADPEGKGVSISFIAPKENGKTFDPVIRNEIILSDIPLKDLLRYICDETGMAWKIEAHTIVIHPRGMSSDSMETRSYPVAPSTVDTIEKDKK